MNKMSERIDSDYVWYQALFIKKLNFWALRQIINKGMTEDV